MASSAVTALLLALAALAAVEGAVLPIAETASPTEMQKWLNSLGSESEELSTKLAAAFLAGKISEPTGLALTTKVTAQTNKIKNVLDGLSRRLNGCSRGSSSTCVKDVTRTYRPKLKTLYSDQHSLRAVVKKLVGN